MKLPTNKEKEMYVSPREAQKVAARKAAAYGHLTPAQVEANKRKSAQAAVAKLAPKGK
jgi:hypothetical protein